MLLLISCSASATLPFPSFGRLLHRSSSRRQHRLTVSTTSSHSLLCHYHQFSPLQAPSLDYFRELQFPLSLLCGSLSRPSISTTVILSRLHYPTHDRNSYFRHHVYPTLVHISVWLQSSDKPDRMRCFLGARRVSWRHGENPSGTA